MSAPKLSAYIDLPTLAGIEIGTRVSGHWAQADREDGIITAIKGEKAKLTFTLKSGNQSWQWVRSLAPVSAADGIKSAKSQASRTLRNAARQVESSRAWLERARANTANRLAHLSSDGSERYISIDYGTCRFPTLWAVLQASGAYRMHHGFAYYTPTAETNAAESADYIAECEQGLEQARTALEQAFAEANQLGLTSKQQEQAFAKGITDAARWS